MFKRKETSLDKALQSTTRGLSFAAPKTEEQQLVMLASLLKSLPKNPVPTGVKHRRYLTKLPAYTQAPRRSTFRALSVVASGLLLLLVVVSANAIQNSGPGETLYTYKKGVEQLRVKFATNPEKKASIQLELSEKRLAEAKTILAEKPEDSKLAAAVITELTQQTQVATHTIQEAAEATTAALDPAMVEQLQKLASEQLALLTKINADTTTPALPDNALSVAEETTKQVESLKHIIAATNESALTTKTPEIIAVSGQLTAVTKETVVVNGTTVHTTENTTITYNNKPYNQQLRLKSKVTITAEKTSESITAKEIVIETLAQLTPPPAPAEAAPPPPPAPAEQTPQPRKSQGSFIPEDPSPQPIN